MGILGSIKNKFAGAEAKGSAFLRAAEHNAKVDVAKGQILALKAAETVANATLDELEKLAAEVHAGRDVLDARLTKITAIL